VSLFVEIMLAGGVAPMTQIAGLVITRQEPLISHNHPDDEVHWYVISVAGQNARFQHRYGDGALMCLRRGLLALDLP
jgi:hypothetical protein